MELSADESLSECGFMTVDEDGHEAAFPSDVDSEDSDVDSAVAPVAELQPLCVACGSAPKACSCRAEVVRVAVRKGRTRFDMQTMDTYPIKFPMCRQHKPYVFS